MSRVYIHEFVDVVGVHRARYQHHMTANWCPEAGPLRRQKCFGVFSVVGSTGRWPQVVNLWEYEGWDALAHNFSVELAGPTHRDPMLEQWWAQAAEFRSGGEDRILVADDVSPGIDDWAARGGTGAVVYVHERISTARGAAPEVARVVVEHAVLAHSGLGLDLVGLFRTAMRADDEVIAVWGARNWPDWSSYESARDERRAGFEAFHDEMERFDAASERVLLVDAALSPLRIGRQPTAQDRRPLSEF